MQKIIVLLFAVIAISWQSNAQGTDCSNPIVIAGLPCTTSDDIANYGDTYEDGSSSCSASYMGGDDVMYTFTPGSNMNVDVLLSHLGSTGSGLHILEGCVDGTNTCSSVFNQNL